MKIAVIGLGWLGETLAKSLSSEGHELWGTVTTVQKQERIASESSIEVEVWNDEISFAPLKQRLFKTDLLICTIPPSPFENDTYSSTLMQLAEALPSSAKVIFTSSIGVYPDLERTMNENQPIVAEHKVSNAENALKSWGENRLCILRLGGLISEDRNPAKFLAKKEINDKPDKRVQLIHRNDIVGVVKMVIKKGQFGEIFNVVNPSRPSRKEYYCQMASQLNLGEIRFTNSDGYVGKNIDVNKLIKELGFTKFEPLLNEE